MHSQLNPGATKRNVEHFITHNGDLDFFTINGVCYELDQLQQLLPLLLHHPLPSRVDSAWGRTIVEKASPVDE